MSHPRHRGRVEQARVVPELEAQPVVEIRDERQRVACRVDCLGRLDPHRIRAALAEREVAQGGQQIRREQQLVRARSDFVSSVSHELRTPLTQIRMFAETLLLDRVRSPGERQRSLEIIDREARRLTNLVENVLRFSREERGEDRIDTQARDVVPLVRRLLADFEPLVAGRARLKATVPDRAIARVDEEALHQILLNLLDNAVKYGPDGQEVRLGVSIEGPRVVFSVEDEGPGIPEAERRRVFERYYRLPRDRRSPVAGTGIGLAVVRDLARLHEGEARVEPSLLGARLVLEVPGASLPGDAA